MKQRESLSPRSRARLEDLLSELERQAQTFVGYPCSQAFDYTELYPFLEYSVNNLGDPFADSNYRINTRTLECEVVDFFANLTHAPRDEFWGYVTNGGTEGNMYGLFLARELFPEGMVYYSEDTHYSVAKVLRVLRMKSIMIKSRPTGEIDCDDLHETVRLHRDVPAIVFANIGTTMKGAIDDIQTIGSIFSDLALTNHYIHCDAALSGMILPFVDEPQPFDFRSGAESISVSGHKMIGAPIPCGVVLARKRNVDRIARSIEYVGALDTTLSGSRNGITPLFLWYAIKKLRMAGLAEMVGRCLDTAEYATKRMRENGIDAWRNRNSITVVFPKPAPGVLEKWQVAVYGRISHVVTMPHVTKAQVDELVGDMVAHAGTP